MNIQEYVQAAAQKRGLDRTVCARVLGDLSYGGMRGSDTCTATARVSVTSLLDRLERKLGKAARDVIDPKSNAPKHAAHRINSPTSKHGNDKAATKKSDAVEDTSNSFDPNATESYAKSLRSGLDPVTGEALHEVELQPGVIALHSPGTRVVYPVPGEANLPLRV